MEESPMLLGDGLSRHDPTQRDTSRHTLTIKQAAELFAKLGVPRSLRSVQRFCEQSHLDCIRVQGEKTERYFIDPLSVERYAAELKQLENISHIGGEASRHDAIQRDVTRSDASPLTPPVIPDPVPEPARETEELRQRVGTLERENLQLAIDRSAKEQVIGIMVDERRNFVDQITTLSRDKGRLEMQVLQLTAPPADASRSDATEVGDAPIAAVEEGRGMPVADPASPAKRSWWPW